MNVSLIILEGKYGDIDADHSSWRSYYIIKLSSYPYTLQSELSINDHFIYSREMVCEGNYFFPININSNHYVLQKTKPINTIF